DRTGARVSRPRRLRGAAYQPDAIVLPSVVPARGGPGTAAEPIAMAGPHSAAAGTVAGMSSGGASGVCCGGGVMASAGRLDRVGTVRRVRLEGHRLGDGRRCGRQSGRVVVRADGVLPLRLPDRRP